MSTADTSVQAIDLTEASGTGSVEVLTPGGIVRVYTGMVNARDGKPAVVVEIEPNTSHRPKTSGGGDWDVEVRELTNMRTYVTLTKREASQ